MEINDKMLEQYRRYLEEQEKSGDTIKKYMSDIDMFIQWNPKEEFSKQEMIDYKNNLINKNLNPSTINTKLSALNGLFKFLNHPELCVKFLRIQKKVFQSEKKELSEQLGNELPSIRKLAEASSTLGASMTPLLLNTATFY